MLNRLNSRIRCLSADERGTSILEFAIIAPVLGMLVVGIGDLGRGFSERHALQQAANRTIERAHLGTKQQNYTFLTTEAVAAAGTGSTAVLDDWVECDGVRNEDFNATCPVSTDPAAAKPQIARYIRLTINKTFTPTFTTVGYPNAVNGRVPISANVTLRVQ
jgi:Flp pilus assembly protein TadG